MPVAIVITYNTQRPDWFGPIPIPLRRDKLFSDPAEKLSIHTQRFGDTGKPETRQKWHKH